MRLVLLMLIVVYGCGATERCMEVSAVMVTWDDLFVEESIASIQACVREVIVVYHGTTGGTKRKTWDNVHVVWVGQENMTLGMAKNYGMSLATGSWILRWDGDFVGYGCGVLQGLCKMAREAGRGTHAFSFVVPRVDGDLAHVRGCCRGGSGPESYLFRRGSMRFGVLGVYDDYPLFNGALSARHSVQTVDARVGLNGTFMLHLGSFRTMMKTVFRPLMTVYHVEMRKRLTKGEMTTGYAAWHYARRFGRMAQGSEEIAAYTVAMVQQGCAEAKAQHLVEFDGARWPHPRYTLDLIENKTRQFLLRRVETTGRKDMYEMGYPDCSRV
jgi:hypothetical protein